MDVDARLGGPKAVLVEADVRSCVDGVNILDVSVSELLAEPLSIIVTGGRKLELLKDPNVSPSCEKPGCWEIRR